MAAVVSGLMAKLGKRSLGCQQGQPGWHGADDGACQRQREEPSTPAVEAAALRRFQNLLGSSGELLKCAHDLAVGGVGGDEIGGSVSSTEGFLSLAPIFTQRIHPQSEVNTCWQQRIRSPHQAR